MLECTNEGYCSDRCEFESVEEFLEMCLYCFEIEPTLRWGHDMDGSTVCRDGQNEIVLREVAQ